MQQSYFDEYTVEVTILQAKANKQPTPTSIIMAEAGSNVLTIWTLGVDVERCLCRDWPSPPDMGKWKVEDGDGDRWPILSKKKRKPKFWLKYTFHKIKQCWNFDRTPSAQLTQKALGLRLGCSAWGNFLAVLSVGIHLGKDWDQNWT